MPASGSAQIDQTIDDISNQIAMLAPHEQARMLVTVHLAAPAEVTGTFRLKYRIAGAGWQPIYDARLTSPEEGKASKIELVRRAAVMQSTTENWSDVALTLSTAQAGGRHGGARYPAAADRWLRHRPRRQLLRGAMPRSSKRRRRQSQAVGEVAWMPRKEKDDRKELKKVEQLQAEVEIAGFQALYAIPGRVSIDNTGTAKNVRIDTSEIDAKLSARAVPKLDPNAYLTAAFTLNGETPLLPGTAMLYRDGVFMGQGYLPLLSPGEETKLGFGADDLIKVKRVEVKRQRGEEGLITTSNIDERAYDITVKNLHGFAIPVTVIDQMPYSAQEDITVETLPGMTPPTHEGFRKEARRPGLELRSRTKGRQGAETRLQGHLAREHGSGHERELRGGDPPIRFAGPWRQTRAQLSLGYLVFHDIAGMRDCGYHQPSYQDGSS